MAINKRLIVWLLKAYIKKWRKTILIFFIAGLVFFFLLRFFLTTIIAKFPVIHKETIGVVGAYTLDTLPEYIVHDVARGLTSVDVSGTPKPDLASSWDIKDSGKTYVFHLKKAQYFTDGTVFNASEITYAFSDVKIERPDPLTIIFHLKDPYAPFLVTVSRPIFRNGFVGLGDFKVKDIKLNSGFVASMTLIGANGQLQVKVYQFYPTEEALRLAFVLGNVSMATGLTDLSFKDSLLNQFPNALVSKNTDYSQLVTLFYNTSDRTLSDKRLRDALSYALPNEFSDGSRANSPFSPASFAYQLDQLHTQQDIVHAKLLMDSISDKIPPLTLSVLPKYKSVAEKVVESWKVLGITVHIKVITGTPDSFQIFLSNFHVPEDPDQYTLWHSDQINNISQYRSLRIDKLLEDGRKTIDKGERIKIYADFQKYLLDDQPASFLYFPYTYAVTRK